MGKHKGFTIVELLIVIVVIAILAAITIVAFNGVQSRAENSKTVNAITAYAKVFSLYAVDNGVYPSTTTYPCLGVPSGGSCGRITSVTGGCAYNGGANQVPAFDSQFASFTQGQLPLVSTQEPDCSGNRYRGSYTYPNSTNTKTLSIHMFLKNTDCPGSIGTAALSTASRTSEVTSCVYNMPTL